MINILDIQFCAKVMQTYFTEICGFSWFFDEKNISKANFRYSILAKYLTVSLHDLAKNGTSILQAKSLWAQKLLILSTYINMTFK